MSTSSGEAAAAAMSSTAGDPMNMAAVATAVEEVDAATPTAAVASTEKANAPAVAKLTEEERAKRAAEIKARLEAAQSGAAASAVVPAGAAGRRVPKGQEDLSAVHKFWETQPMLAFTEEADDSGPIEAQRTVDEVKKDEYAMPAGFVWSSIDVTDTAQINEVYTLLSENYVEDDDNMFRFDYSIPFLQWALTPPGYHPEWHIGVRNGSTGKLLAFITGIPANIRVHSNVMPMAEINFLCVHKKLRHKRLAPVLIKEVTRRVNLHNIWQAVYTAGVVLPKPVSKCRYWHRSINPKKLVEIRFTSLKPRMTLAQTIKHYRLPSRTAHMFETMELADAPGAYEITKKYLSERCKLAHEFSLEEFTHMVLPRDKVVNSFVLKKNGVVTDFISFYHLPSTVIGNPKHDHLYAAYSYYNVATTMPLTDLMKDALILARNIGIDVFNGLDVMDNLEAYNQLLFGIGDGHLQYYVYNWRCPTIEARDVGLVLL